MTILKVGTRIVKVRAEPNDIHPIGEKGTVVSVTAAPEPVELAGHTIHAGYFVEWDAGYIGFIIDWKIAENTDA